MIAKAKLKVKMVEDYISKFDSKYLTVHLETYALEKSLYDCVKILKVIDIKNGDHDREFL